MKTKSVYLTVTFDDGSTEQIAIKPEAVVVPPTPIPPTPTNKKYVMLNAINWNASGLTTLPLPYTSEVTYFVLPVSSNGDLLGGSDTLEKAFVANVKGAGKKASFSIGGGSQNASDIGLAVSQKTNLVANIVSHMTQYGYDGVTLDIENTSIPPQVIVDFIKALRIAIGSTKIIGMYVQPYQLTSVWTKLKDAESSINWLAPMIYDAGAYNATSFRAQVKAWEVYVPKTKLLAGVAVNYPSQSGGLNATQYAEVLDMVNQEGWLGAGIWENTLFTAPYQAIQKSKFPDLV